HHHTPPLFPYTTLFRSSSSRTGCIPSVPRRCGRREKMSTRAIGSPAMTRPTNGPHRRFWPPSRADLSPSQMESSSKQRRTGTERSEEHTSELQSPDHLV